MTTATIARHHRPVLPFVSLFIASGAVVLSVVAMTADDVATSNPPVAETADRTTPTGGAADAPTCELAVPARVVRC